ncbi:MAG: VWA domain-containing protein [Acidobacteriota bacterium]
MSWLRSAQASMVAGPWIALAMLVPLFPRPASAARSAIEPREAQFVFIIDDSGSMSESRGRGPDPDRLAVFAVRALLGVLDERDSVSVIRLNGPSEGEPQTGLDPLAPGHRDEMKRTLDLSGKLAAYDGSNTPCRTALQEAFSQLKSQDQPAVSQVVIFLTDGSCTPPGEERVLDLLEDLPSHQQNRFQFYLLEFERSGASPDLRRMVEETGGATRPLRGGDPTQILNTFALALSRSQGYESQILRPTDGFLPAHHGARSVSLLAVAPGDSPDLEILVTPRGGGRRVPVEVLDKARHHFAPDGKKYRFTSARYRPTGEPMTVTVKGAGESWEMVALPEYRLASEFEILQGPCSGEGPPATDVVGVHSDLCAVITLVNEQGEVVGPDITAAQLQGEVVMSTESVATKEIREEPAAADQATFRLDLPTLPEGIHTIRAQVLMIAPNGSSQPLISAGSRTLQAIDRSIQPQPAKAHFGDVYPGNSYTKMLALEGNYTKTPVKLRLMEGADLPACVTLTFADRPLGGTVKVRSGKSYPLQLVVAEDCGPDGVYPVEEARLQVAMEKLPEVGTITVPLGFRLDSTVRQAETLRFELEAGSAGEGVVNPPPAEPGVPARAMVHYDATIEPLSRQGKPADNLPLGFLDEQSDVRMLLDSDGEVVRQRQVAIAPNEPLTLRVEVPRCCSSGTYWGELRLVPVDGGAPVVAKVQVVATSNWWVCYRPWVLGGLLGLLAGLLTFYIASMFTSVQWLSRDQLATRLVPLYWPTYGGNPQPGTQRADDREVVLEIIKAGIPWSQRIQAWWRANPFVFGLPWRTYRETAELNLAPRLELSSVDFKGERDIVGRLQGNPEIDPGDEGRLFARAGSGIHFFAVRGPRGKVGNLTPQGWYGKADDYTIEQLTKNERLIHRIAASERTEGHIGGWELG